MADKTMDLLQAYTFNGATFGPGQGVTVPEDFPDVSKAEAGFAAQQAERDRPAGAVLVPASMDTLAEVATGKPSQVPDKATGTGATVGGKSADELASMSKAELVTLAEEKGLDVTRADGDGEPLKDDYVAALSAPAA